MKEGKWLFIWDKTGSLHTSFKIKGGVICEFYEEVLEATLRRKPLAESLEVVRKFFVDAQRNGANLMLDLSMTQPDFKNRYTSEDVFPAATAFNRAEWIKHEVYMRYVKDKENY